jgi:hypothetical protein
MDLLTSPHEPIFYVFQNIDLAGSFWRTLFPAAPIGIVIVIILSGTGLKDLIPGFGPGEFITDLVHW